MIDFRVLQINSDPVANSTHDRCVHLLMNAGDILMLKVTKSSGSVGSVPRVSPPVTGRTSSPVCGALLSFLGSLSFFQFCLCTLTSKVSDSPSIYTYLHVKLILSSWSLPGLLFGMGSVFIADPTRGVMSRE